MTVAHTLSVIAVHVIKDEKMFKKLQTELKTVMPMPYSQPTWNQLEQLPFLVSLHLMSSMYDRRHQPQILLAHYVADCTNYRRSKVRKPVNPYTVNGKLQCQAADRQ